MTDYEGAHDLRLTAPGETVSKPKFSPDGRISSYLSSREADGQRQIYLLDRQRRRPAGAHPRAGGHRAVTIGRRTGRAW